MALELEVTEYLFSYGTLQTAAVQLATFGRRLEGKPDVLVGYSLAMIQIQDQDFAAASGAHQRIIQFTGSESDLVEGTVFPVTRKDLERADTYEPAEYQRVLVRLKSGLNAWVYVNTRNASGAG